MPQPPETDEGWYVLHDLRRIDWDAWRSATSAERDRAIDEGRGYLESAAELEDIGGAADASDVAGASGVDGASNVAGASDVDGASNVAGASDVDGASNVADASDVDGASNVADASDVDGPASGGDSAVFAILGHEADLMCLHLRPTLAHLDTLERQFARTALAGFTERTASYVSVTEASGYTGAEDYFDPDAEADPGIVQYIESRLYPEIPETGFVSFYPMDKRREPDQNWYDLPFGERAEHMAAHGEIGRQYAGDVSQIISGSIGLDDFEWGVTLFGEDPTDVKDLLYEMRFDPSSSRYASFGSFYAGRRFPPADLEAFLSGEAIPTAEIGGETDPPPTLDDELDAIGADAPAAGHGVLVRSDAPVDAVRDEVDGLRGNFEHYDSHLGTEVVAAAGEGEARSAVVSSWETASAADTARGFLAELDGATETTVGPVGDGGDDVSGEPMEGDATDGRGPAATADASAEGIRESLEERGIYAGSPHGEDVYALVVYSEADADEVATAVADLADGFDRYDTHRWTATYDTAVGAADAERAVVSLWDTEDAAETAGDYLADLPGVVRQAGEAEGFGTMGMFYTVEPEHRGDFVETFETVGGLLAEMAGHRETTLYANRDDENDMFVASRWDAKEDAMAFFRSEEFAETVQWGREVLADRPRHVFLA